MCVPPGALYDAICVVNDMLFRVLCQRRCPPHRTPLDDAAASEKDGDKYSMRS